MSSGPGEIERRIAELFAATRDHTLSASLTSLTQPMSSKAAGQRAPAAGRDAGRAQRLAPRERQGRAQSCVDRSPAQRLDGVDSTQAAAVSSGRRAAAGLGRLDPAGGRVWADAEIVRITERNVMVRYADVTARLDRFRLRDMVGVVARRALCFQPDRPHCRRARRPVVEALRRRGWGRAAGAADAPRRRDRAAGAAARKTTPRTT